MWTILSENWALNDIQKRNLSRSLVTMTFEDVNIFYFTRGPLHGLSTGKDVGEVGLRCVDRNCLGH